MPRTLPISLFRSLSPSERARAGSLIDQIVELLPPEMQQEARHILEFGGGFGGPGTDTPQLKQLYGDLRALYRMHALLPRR